MKHLKFNDDVLMVKNCDHADLRDISDDWSHLVNSYDELLKENATLQKRIKELEHFAKYCSSFSGCESSKSCIELHSITTEAEELLRGR